MPRHPYEHDHDQYVADLKARQRNIVFPDTVRNGRAVDKLLWKGDPDAPLVQRIGMLILGICCGGTGLTFIFYFSQDDGFGRRCFSIMIGLVVLAYSARIAFDSTKRCGKAEYSERPGKGREER
ncbi:MAG TPA: hypothetical protein VGN17_13580 [Bryobacteraceae bacterium]|jgi:hypothetical protein